jgi:hypothetical protein
MPVSNVKKLVKFKKQADFSQLKIRKADLGATAVSSSNMTVCLFCSKEQLKKVTLLGTHCKKCESYLPQESVWLAGGPTQTS